MQLHGVSPWAGYLTSHGKHTQKRRQGELCPTPEYALYWHSNQHIINCARFMSLRHGTVNMFCGHTTTNKSKAVAIQ